MGSPSLQAMARNCFLGHESWATSLQHRPWALSLEPSVKPCLGGCGLALAAKPPKILVFEVKIEIIGKIAVISVAGGAGAFPLRQKPPKILVFETKIEIISKIAAIYHLSWGAAALPFQQNPRKSYFLEQKSK